jgi:3-oxoacyl-[acyl-carrier protein] reductase
MLEPYYQPRSGASFEYLAVASTFTHMSSLALVTGANRGIGLAIAKALKAAGHDVVVSYRSGEAPEGFKSVLMDVTDSASVEAGFAKIEAEIGQPEIIVANAGITKDGLVMRMSDEDFESVIDANLTGAFRVSKRATKGLLKLKRGRLIFIGSVVGGVGAAGQVNYSASKSGLVGMARSYARELGSRGITANVIAPGFVETDMTADLDEKRRNDIAAQVPLGRFCSAEEIADVVTFIASPQASYITGAIIPVDGGLGMGH